jgi:hypothetical protein
METINKARSLPVFRICETDFYVDMRLNEFRQVDAPWNRISMDEIREMADDATELVFDRLTRNIYEGLIDPENIPSNVTLVIVPPLKELDPIGLARKFGLPDDTYIKKQMNKHRRGRRL